MQYYQKNAFLIIALIYALLQYDCANQLKFKKANRAQKLPSHLRVYEKRKMALPLLEQTIPQASEPSKARVGISPDVDFESHLEMCQMIAYRGYPCEEHFVETKDGFILGLFRIPHGKNAKPGQNDQKTRKSGKGGQPIFLQHGLLDSSFTWINNFPDESLGYILADAGFDVWMGNSRGNYYARNNTKLKPDQKAFWWWSWDQMAKYDLPANYDYILGVSGYSKVVHIGHSQGTTMAFAALSTYPAIAAQVRLFVALAPVTRVAHLQGFVRTFVPYASDITAAIEAFGTGEMLPRTEALVQFTREACGGPLSIPICAKVLCDLEGPDERSFNATRIPIYTSHAPAGTSMLNLLHFAQEIASGQFQWTDYGTATNQLEYGQPTAPLYYPGNITVPTGLFHSSMDTQADAEDVDWLISQMRPSTIVFEKRYDQYSHLGFIWSPSAHLDLYPDVVALIHRYS